MCVSRRSLRALQYLQAAPPNMAGRPVADVFLSKVDFQDLERDKGVVLA